MLTFLAYINMLVGLASDDTATLLENAEFRFFANQAHMIVGYASYRLAKEKIHSFFKTPNWMMKKYDQFDLMEQFLKLMYHIDPWKWSDKKKLRDIIAEAKRLLNRMKEPERIRTARSKQN